MEMQVFLNEVIELMPSIVRLNRALMQKIEVPDELELTPSQICALTVLHKYKTVSMSQLSEFLDMHKQQTTKVTDGLANKGYIVRKTDPNDRRIVLIEFSPEGTAVMGKITSEHQGVCERFFSLMTSQQQEKFYDAFTTIKEILSDIEQKPIPAFAPDKEK